MVVQKWLTADMLVRVAEPSPRGEETRHYKPRKQKPTPQMVACSTCGAKMTRWAIVWHKGEAFCPGCKFGR
jgi:hypothetical protein